VTATFSSADVARMAGVPASTVSSRWAPRFGYEAPGSGGRHRWTLGHLVVLRAVRRSGITIQLASQFCAEGPALVDERLPRPRYLVLADQIVTTADDPAELVAMAAETRRLHIIDVEATLRDLAVTPHE
jgi:hypothetical protein